MDHYCENWEGGAPAPRVVAETTPVVRIVEYLAPWVSFVIAGLGQHYSMDSAENDPHVSHLVKNDVTNYQLHPMVRKIPRYFDLHGMALPTVDGT